MDVMDVVDDVDWTVHSVHEVHPVQKRDQVDSRKLTFRFLENMLCLHGKGGRSNIYDKF